MSHSQTIKEYRRLKREAPSRLRALRGGLSYGKLAARLGCDRSYLWKIEHGQETISDELLLKLLVLEESS
jgi:transcriptional regulator with XRE-family HTH domain